MTFLIIVVTGQYFYISKLLLSYFPHDLLQDCVDSKKGIFAFNKSYNIIWVSNLEKAMFKYLIRIVISAMDKSVVNSTCLTCRF